MRERLASANRVDPWGRHFSTPERGYLMGNRDSGDAWIARSLRHPDGTTGPSSVSYFKLFFLDEPTALAAGHRPCAQCRKKDYEVFRKLMGAASKDEIDRALRAETGSARVHAAKRATSCRQGRCSRSMAARGLPVVARRVRAGGAHEGP